MTLASGAQVVRFENVLAPNERINDAFDACYVPRTFHLTAISRRPPQAQTNSKFTQIQPSPGKPEPNLSKKKALVSMSSVSISLLLSNC